MFKQIHCAFPFLVLAHLVWGAEDNFDGGCPWSLDNLDRVYSCFERPVDLSEVLAPRSGLRAEPKLTVK